MPDCEFETDFCGWNVEAELNGTEFFIFIRTQGKLHEDGDGPKTDHTTSDSGIGHPNTHIILNTDQFKVTSCGPMQSWVTQEQ